MSRFDNPGERFHEEMVAQDVMLAPPIENAMNRLWIHDHHSLGYKTPILYGIVAAGIELQTRPNAELTDKPINVEALEADMPSAVLAGLLNASHKEVEQRQAAMAIRKPAKTNYGVCADEDRAWNRTFDVIESGESAPLLQVFMNDGEPAVLRRGRGTFPTGLTLTDVALGKRGIVYPAGSIVQMSVPGETYLPGGKKLQLSLDVPEVLPVEAIRDMSFSRLSPFAVPVAQRPAHFAGEPVGERELEDIKALVADAVNGQEMPHDVPRRHSRWNFWSR